MRQNKRGVAAGMVLALDDRGSISHWEVKNPHPEVTLTALFGKLWYEGYARPEYVWQSTGGTDDYEAKFSLIPPIYGTLKGTFYALLFAVPLALAGALYTSQLMHPRLKGVIKPAVEIMAALPSVVLGFIAGLWLAPMMERVAPGIFLMPIVIPLIFTIAEDYLSNVPHHLMIASLALGATRWQTATRVVLPTASPGIFSAIMIGFGRAVGETMILAMARAAGEVAPLMITGVVKLAPALPVDGVWPFLHQDRKFMHLGFHIYGVGFQSPNVDAAADGLHYNLIASRDRHCPQPDGHHPAESAPKKVCPVGSV